MQGEMTRSTRGSPPGHDRHDDALADAEYCPAGQGDPDADFIPTPQYLTETSAHGYETMNEIQHHDSHGEHSPSRKVKRWGR